MQQPTVQKNNIDEIIAHVISFKDEWSQILPELNALTKEQCLAFTTDGVDPLTLLDPSVHSLAYSYFITTRCLATEKENAIQLYQLLSNFIRVFDPEQLTLSPLNFKLIGLSLTHLAKLVQKPLLPLQDFKLAIERYSQSPLVLTSLHSMFIKACLSAKMYKYPQSILDYDIETIDLTKNALDIQTILEYFYYGSIVYIANKKWDRALEFLSFIISAPAKKAVSAIQIAAYKKYILACLIHERKLKTLPLYTATDVGKACRGSSGPYKQLADSFENTDIKSFQETASRFSNVFESDKHIGLVKQCFRSIQRKKIKELTKIYLAVELDDMAQKIGSITPQQLELVLIEMIEQKDVLARISVTEDYVKMVHFYQDEEVDQVELEESIISVSNISKKVQHLNKLEDLNKDFQAKYLNMVPKGTDKNAKFFNDESDYFFEQEFKLFPT